MPTPIDFDAPAFAKVEEPSTETATAVVSQTESGKEEGSTNGGTSAQESVVEEQRIPYSRMKTVLDRARDAEREAADAHARYTELLESRHVQDTSTPYEDAIRDRIVRLYGDNDVSKEIIKLELDRQTQLEARAEQRALEAVRNERQSETRLVANNERTIDNRLEDLSGYLGRDLTDHEESVILDIVDDYTPKGDDGMYLGDTISFEKAWEIYELQNAQQAQTSKRSRSKATVITSSQSDGEPSGQDAKSNESWNPLDWNSYKKRI